MVVVGHEIPGFVLPGERVGWRARARAKRDAELAESREELRIIEESGIIGKLVMLAQSRPGKYKIGVSEPKAGRDMTVVMISGKEYNFRPVREVVWNSVVVGVARDGEGHLLEDLKVNGVKVPHAADDTQIMQILKGAVDVPYPRGREILDRRERKRDYRDEIRMKGRKKIKIPR